MTWIRKYILNRIVSYAVWLLGVFLAFYIVVIESHNSLTDFFFVFLYFILPPLYCLAYVNYLNKKHGIWLKCFQATLLLGVAGIWTFLIYGIYKWGWFDLQGWEIVMLFYIFLLPITFLEAFFSKSVLTKKEFITFLKFFLKKIVWVPIASIVSFAVVWTLIVMVSIGGFQNLKERIYLEKFIYFYPPEITCVWSQDTAAPTVAGWWKEYTEFEFKYDTQHWDYFNIPQRELLDKRDPDTIKESLKKAKSFLPFFKGDPKAQIQQAYLSNDKVNFTFNHCNAVRWLTRAAHQGDKEAQELLIGFYPSYTTQYLTDVQKNMDLSNPVIAYQYALLLDDKLNSTEQDKNVAYDPEAIRYLEQSANAGYIRALAHLETAYSKVSNSKEYCSKRIKIYEDRAAQKSFLSNWVLLFNYMGKKFGGTFKECFENKKPDFSKAFSLILNNKSYSESEHPSILYYEALFYLNGWSVQQDYLKSYKLFNECYDKRGSSLGLTSCISYLSYMTLKGLGTAQDTELGGEIFLTKLGTEPTTNNNGISCGGETIEYIRVDSSSIDDPVLSEEEQKKIDSEKAKEQEKMNAIYARVVQCIMDADRETLLAIVEAHIRDQLSEFYKNEELLATLNVMGEPQ